MRLEGLPPPFGRRAAPGVLGRRLPRLADHLTAHGVRQTGVDQGDVLGVTLPQALDLLGRRRLERLDLAGVAVLERL